MADYSKLKLKPKEWYVKATNRDFRKQIEYLVNYCFEHSESKITFKHLLILGVGLDRKNWKRDLKKEKVVGSKYKQERLEWAMAIQEANLIEQAITDERKAYEYLNKAYGQEYEQEVINSNPPTQVIIDFKNNIREIPRDLELTEQPKGDDDDAERI